MTLPTKRCTTCGKDKRATGDYFPTRRGGLEAECRMCKRAAYKRRYYRDRGLGIPRSL